MISEEDANISNKRNNNPWNLITLCKKCHLRKEYKWFREYLYEYQKVLLKAIYGREDIFNVSMKGQST